MTTANRLRTGTTLTALAIGLALGGTALAQTPTGQEHDAHHPEGTTAQTAPAPGLPRPQGSAPGTMGGQAMPTKGMPGAQQGGMPGMMGGDMGRMMEMMHRRMAAQAALSPFRYIEGQLAFYRAELRITDAQQPQWNAFADAIRASAERLRQVYTQAAQTAGQPLPAPAQLERRTAALSVLTETTRTVAAAMGPLYASLSDEQKRTADELLTEHLDDMRRRGL